MAVRISAVAHANVNCSDLERSKRFYTELLGLRAGAHTRPARPQDCRAFGLPGDGQWDAWMLTAADDPGGTAIDLLEWKLPRPAGRPPAQANQLGFARLCFEIPDATALHARLLSARIKASIAWLRGARGLVTRDPDGTSLQLDERPVGSTRPASVVVHCADLSRSLDWYQSVLALEAKAAVDPPATGEALGLPGPIEWEGALLFPRDRPASFGIQLVEWKRPRPIGRPAAQANHLGIFRMAFLVEDAHAAWDELRARGVVCPPPAWLEMGPEIPIEGLWALFFPDPDGTCLELIQSPRVLSP